MNLDISVYTSTNANFPDPRIRRLKDVVVIKDAFEHCYTIPGESKNTKYSLTTDNRATQKAMGVLTDRMRGFRM